MPVHRTEPADDDPADDDPAADEAVPPAGGWLWAVTDEAGGTAVGAGGGEPLEKAAMALATPAMALTTAAPAAQSLAWERPVDTGAAAADGKYGGGAGYCAEWCDGSCTIPPER
ncbi:hypothetical protein GCM10010347_14630 [Streptomyces cirratus]|uniref:Uncharacterized protein n=1 Tax=Streptomyces cirratus TaxID=68187 RepID=A0ABQ3EQH7_9ACTN|nr:hypothetical protein [Streptomyces cirratus]GHB46088.1 hypothetical protein GCM10010347_14630 [Streptomyces cirratus]